MISLYEVFAILFIHWVGDFVCQTDWMAKNKSKSWKPLLLHTGTYSVIFPFLGVIIFPVGYFWEVLLFTVITFACHTITDYFTSRLNSKLWADGKVHNFFVSIGFDQTLHYVQLFLTYYLLFK